jgi:eukaryotic-like serine/threonine-protein kinase
MNRTKLDRHRRAGPGRGLRRVFGPGAWVALVLSAVLLPSSAAARSSVSPAARSSSPGWPKVHYDQANTGYNPFEQILNPTNVPDLVLKWAVPTVNGASPTPVVSGGLVYVAPADGTVRALDAATGSTVWTVPLGEANDGDPPTVADGLVFLGSDTGVITALDAVTGDVRWSVDLGDSSYESPTVANGVVYVTATREKEFGTSFYVYALDELTGQGLWRHGLIASGVPAVAGGRVYETDAFGCLVVAFDAHTGHLDWDFSTGCEIGSVTSVAASKGMVFAGVDGYLWALDAATGDIRWSRTPAGTTYATPALANGVVYFASSEDLSALRQSTGALIWTVPLAGGTYASPALANGVVYMSAHYRLRAWDAASGAPLWASDLAAAPFGGSPAVADGVLYGAADDGTVYAFGLP